MPAGIEVSNSNVEDGFVSAATVVADVESVTVGAGVGEGASVEASVFDVSSVTEAGAASEVTVDGSSDVIEAAVVVVSEEVTPVDDGSMTASEDAPRGVSEVVS